MSTGAKFTEKFTLFEFVETDNALGDSKLVHFFVALSVGNFRDVKFVFFNQVLVSLGGIKLPFRSYLANPYNWTLPWNNHSSAELPLWTHWNIKFVLIVSP